MKVHLEISIITCNFSIEGLSQRTVLPLRLLEIELQSDKPHNSKRVDLDLAKTLSISPCVYILFIKVVSNTAMTVGERQIRV
jgi:hypothetical protein